MPENWFPKMEYDQNGNGAQNQKHLKETSTEELTDALAELWDDMDEYDFDPQKIDSCLEELDQQEASAPQFDVEASLNAFREKHKRLMAQNTHFESAKAKKPARRIHRHGALIAAVLIVILLFGMMTVQALGVDVFGTIAKWTDEVFHFHFSSAPLEETPASNPSAAGQYNALQKELDKYKITQSVAPTWYPEGYELRSVEATESLTGIRMIAIFEGDGLPLIFTVQRFDSSEAAQIGAGYFEKDANEVLEYVSGNITHYIFSNVDSKTAV